MTHFLFPALLEHVHWNRHVHQPATLQLMGWFKKSVENLCWLFFVRFSLPPEFERSGLKKKVLYGHS
jgi:hypothetical protein